MTKIACIAKDLGRSTGSPVLGLTMDYGEEGKRMKAQLHKPEESVPPSTSVTSALAQLIEALGQQRSGRSIRVSMSLSKSANVVGFAPGDFQGLVQFLRAQHHGIGVGCVHCIPGHRWTGFIAHPFATRLSVHFGRRG